MKAKTTIKGTKGTIKLVVDETIEKIAIRVNTPEKMQEQSSTIEAFVMPTQKTISLDLGKFRDAMTRMNVAQLEALGRSLVLIATTAKKHIK